MVKPKSVKIRAAEASDEELISEFLSEYERQRIAEGEQPDSEALEYEVKSLYDLGLIRPVWTERGLRIVDILQNRKPR